jgi:uncharacterized protein YhjY with autotransporter beta-barrel domain
MKLVRMRHVTREDVQQPGLGFSTSRPTLRSRQWQERRIPAEHEQLAMKRALLYSHSVVGVSADEEGTNVTLGMFARSDFEDVAQARLPEVSQSVTQSLTHSGKRCEGSTQ